MKTPEDLAEIARLKGCGWGLKRIARELGCSHHTVKVSTPEQKCVGGPA